MKVLLFLLLFFYSVSVSKTLFQATQLNVIKNKLVEMGVGYDHKKYFLKQKKKKSCFYFKYEDTFVYLGM